MSGSAVRPSLQVLRDRSRPLDPMRSEWDYRILEMHAYRNGWRVRFRDGRVINPEREKRPDFPDPRDAWEQEEAASPSSPG